MPRKNLKAARIEKKLTQEEIAKELKISVRTYRNIEQGIRFPRENLLWKILRIFNTTDITLLINNSSIKGIRGSVSKRIVENMNALKSSNASYTIETIKLIRLALNKELKDRKENNLRIRSYTKEGKWEIYNRVACIANKKIEEKKLDMPRIKSEDIPLFKRCVADEFTNRTGKTTWGIEKERIRNGYGPHSGRLKVLVKKK